MRPRGMFWSTLLLFSWMAALLTGCESGAGGTGESHLQDEPVTLKMVHWIGTEAGPVVSEINKRFHKEYPNISIEVEYAPVDQYQSLIRSRFVAGGAPDIVGIFPGTWMHPFAQSGYLLDLSGSDWESRLEDNARLTMTMSGKLYALPVNRNAIGVLYDKKLFEEKGYAIPRTWNEFLALCERIKQQGLAPIALGLKDQWVTQIIPFAMAPTAIYRDHPGFDRDMYAGTASFSDSSWLQMLKDYINLAQKGYFSKGYLGTTYDQMVQMLATGKAAMMVMGNWSLGPIALTNPNAEIGMFPLPYTTGKQTVQTATGVSIGIGIASSTPYPEEAKKYVEFWSRPDINALFVSRTKSFSVFKDVQPALDPAQKQIQSAFQSGTYSFLDQKWPPGVQDTLFQVIQNLMADGAGYTVDRALREMDRIFTQNKAGIHDIP